VQHKFIQEFAAICKKKAVNMAMETNLSVSWQVIINMLPHINYWYVDLKHADEKKHWQYTGKSNKKVIQNMEKMAVENIPVTVRTPVVPGFNDSQEELDGLKSLVAQWNNVIEHQLLPYHELGTIKHEQLGYSSPIKW
jgi:pyruvate formate lyase activating enzyme